MLEKQAEDNPDGFFKKGSEYSKPRMLNELNRK